MILSSRRPIIVVDDDLSVRTSIKRLLREHGFPVLLFDSAHSLLDHRELGKAVCIIIDINLDGESGIDLRRRLAGEGVTSPVIYITGNDSQANRSAALASGCIAYLTKPFMAQSLMEPIQRAVSGAT